MSYNRDPVCDCLIHPVAFNLVPIYALKRATMRSVDQWLTLVLFVLVAVEVVDTRQVYQHSEWNKTPGNAGVKIRLTKKGINHLKTVAVRLLNEQIATLSGYSTQFAISQTGFDGVVTLRDVRVLHYNPPQVSVVNFLPPRYVIFGLENMDISLAGAFYSSGGPFQVEGFVDGTISGMTVALTAEFATDVDGIMGVQVPNCSTVITHSHFNIDPQGPMGPLVKTLEEHFKDFRLIDSPVIKKFVNDFVRGMYINNLHISDPVVTNEFFETQQKGEIRYDNNEEVTPFYPRPMYTDGESDRMLYFYGSDYIFNSLLYHAYQTNKLSLKLNRKNISKKYRGFLMTSCHGTGNSGDFTSSICVGKLIPPIAETYPNTTTSFVILPHGLPDFQFNGDAGAIMLSTRVLTYVDDHGQEKQIMVSSAEGQADVLLYARNGRLGGDLKLNRLSVRLHRTSLAGMDPSSIEQIAPLAKTFIGPQLSQALKKGIPFPLQDSITFVEPQLQTRDGYIVLATDFVLNENALRAKIHETFANINI
ncbi:LBP / BPI / CETP family protein [Trichostrongylus colubriformis]|uniref:LBP / BPI / CETP family protein n=1 Tax=Trichostrongylus colubriformis TaxID=6319 RepID=A0AAN8IKS7_TRICO